MAAEPNFSDILNKTLHGNRVEPKQRWVGGRFGWAIHRFPIKGGISVSAIIAENVTKSNALFAELKKRGHMYPGITITQELPYDR